MYTTKCGFYHVAKVLGGFRVLDCDTRNWGTYTTAESAIAAADARSNADMIREERALDRP